MAQQPEKTESEVKVQPLGLPMERPAIVDRSSFTQAVGDAESLTRQIIAHQRQMTAETVADDRTIAADRQVSAIVAQYRSRAKGEAAQNTKPVLDAMDEAIEEQLKTIKDPLAQKLFRAESRRRILIHAQRVEDHAATEYATWEHDSYVGKRSLGKEQAKDAVLPTETEGAFEKSKSDLEAGITSMVHEDVKYLIKKGHDPADKSGFVAQALTKSVKEGLDAYLDASVAVASTTGTESAAAARHALKLLEGDVTVSGNKFNVATTLGAKDLALWKHKLAGISDDEGGRASGINAALKVGPLSRWEAANPAGFAVLEDQYAPKDAKGVRHVIPGKAKEFEQANLSLATYNAREQVKLAAEYSTYIGGVASVWNATRDITAVTSSAAWKQIASTREAEKLLTSYKEALLKDARAPTPSKRTDDEWSALSAYYKETAADAPTPKMYDGTQGIGEFEQQYGPAGKTPLNARDYADLVKKVGGAAKVVADPPWVKEKLRDAEQELTKIATGGMAGVSVSAEQVAGVHKAKADIEATLRAAANASGGKDRPVDADKVYEDAMKKWRDPVTIGKRFLGFVDDTRPGLRAEIAKPGTVAGERAGAPPPPPPKKVPVKVTAPEMSKEEYDKAPPGTPYRMPGSDTVMYKK
jgi:hypothetical protein